MKLILHSLFINYMFFFFKVGTKRGFSPCTWTFSGYAMALLVKALRYQPEVSIPDGVIRNFHWLNISGRTMPLEPTQPLRVMSKR
jgi:hypothetical protein